MALGTALSGSVLAVTFEPRDPAARMVKTPAFAAFNSIVLASGESHSLQVLLSAKD
jgi:hypothetical protein